jgi:hypothetical protein
MTGRRRAALFALLALLGAVALLAAGCGGSDSESAATETTTETVTETTAEDETTETTTEETTTEDTSGLGAIGSGDCADLAKVSAQFSQALSQASASGDPQAVEDLFKALADKAPSEIKDDLAVLADAIGVYVKELKGIDLSSGAAASPETIQKLQELAQKFSDPKYQQASKNIQAWVTKNCGSSTG